MSTHISNFLPCQWTHLSSPAVPVPYPDKICSSSHKDVIDKMCSRFVGLPQSVQPRPDVNLQLWRFDGIWSTSYTEERNSIQRPCMIHAPNMKDLGTLSHWVKLPCWLMATALTWQPCSFIAQIFYAKPLLTPLPLYFFSLPVQYSQGPVFLGLLWPQCLHALTTPPCSSEHSRYPLSSLSLLCRGGGRGMEGVTLGCFGTISGLAEREHLECLCMGVGGAAPHLKINALKNLYRTIFAFQFWYFVYISIFLNTGKRTPFPTQPSGVPTMIS